MIARRGLLHAAAVLAVLAVGANALSQRAAAARVELQVGGRAAAAGTRPRPPAPRWWQPGGSLRTGTPAPGRTQIGPDTGPADHLRATKNKPISDSLYDSLSVIPL